MSFVRSVSEAGVRARAGAFPRGSFRRVAAVLMQPDAELSRRQVAQATLECKYRSEASLLQLRGPIPPLLPAHVCELSLVALQQGLSCNICSIFLWMIRYWP